METRRVVLYLGDDTARALAEYARRHAGRFRSQSRAADHLLTRALTGELDEGTERLLAPTLVAAVREAVRREVADGVGVLVERQSGRLAGLLVASGKDAHRGARLAEVVLGHLLADPARAARVAEEAGLQAGARYGTRARPMDEAGSPLPPGGVSRPPGAQK